MRLKSAAFLLPLAMFATGVMAQDSTPPTILSHSLSDVVSKTSAGVVTMRVRITFSEPMNAVDAAVLSHYTFAGSTVSAATLKADGTNLVLSVDTPPAAGAAYSLTVDGVADLAGNPLASTVLSGTVGFYEVNWALTGTASQSTSQPVGGGAELAIDGNTDGFYNNGSVTLNGIAENGGWLEVDLGEMKPVGKLHAWFRTLTADECQALFNACGVRNDDFTLSVLDENRNVVWTRTYPGRPPLNVSYNLPAGIIGRFVRFEAQNPRTTSDGFFSLAELQVIEPYSGVSITVNTQPTPKFIEENRVATFGPVSATLNGAPADRLQYQWQVGGVDIPGANGASYQTPTRTLVNDGEVYRCVFLAPGVSQNSDAASLTVTADTTPPTIKSVTGSSSLTFVTVVFSEAVQPGTLEDPVNLAFDLLNISDRQVLSPTTVRLTTSLQTAGQTYTLYAAGVNDIAATPNVMADAQITFTAAASQEDRWATVGDPGNPPNVDFGSGPQGSVNYVFQIGKYEVNNTEYAAFLNAKAKSDPNSLWDGGMHITRDGADGSYSYTVQAGWEKRPVYFTAAVDAYRYVNWLNNGAQDYSDTETGAYTLTGYDTVSARNPNADYFLPSENEWHKAAYYDPTKDGTGGYWLYANKNSLALPFLHYGAPFDQGSLCFLPSSGPGATDVCDEDLSPQAASYYGTYNQSGSVWEWNELPNGGNGGNRPRRCGGSWGNNEARIAASVRADNAIGNNGASINQGFRVARVFRPRPVLVTVGNPGNPPNQDFGSGPQGTVNYVYQIGKYEVNNTEYAAFLNAKAKSDPNSLWDGGMHITRSGTDGSYTYTVQAGWEKRPVYYTAAVDAYRYANWLNNGGTEASDTESGSYTLVGYDTVSARSPNARIVLPSENEWHKAAYYDPTKGGTGGYWLYANRNSTALPFLHYGAPFDQGSLCFLPSSGPGATDVCDEDISPEASSFYGTYNQSGSVWEWNELPFGGNGGNRPRRCGGSWGNNEARIAASVRADNAIGNGGASINQGFRIAQVPPGLKLTITRSSGFAQLSWPGSGVLESAPAVNGPWTTVTGVNGNLHVVPLNVGDALFFRIKQ